MPLTERQIYGIKHYRKNIEKYKQYYKDNREEIIKKNKERYNKEVLSRKNKKDYENRKKNNFDKVEYYRRYRENNREKIRQYGLNNYKIKKYEMREKQRKRRINKKKHVISEKSKIVDRITLEFD